MPRGEGYTIIQGGSRPVLSVVQYGQGCCSEVVDETVVVKLCCGIVQLTFIIPTDQ